MKTGEAAGVLIGNLLKTRSIKKAEAIVSMFDGATKQEALNKALSAMVEDKNFVECGRVLKWGGRITKEATRNLVNPDMKMDVVEGLRKLLSDGAKHEDFKIDEIRVSVNGKKHKIIWDLPEYFITQGDSTTYEKMMGLGFTEMDPNKITGEGCSAAFNFLMRNRSKKAWEFLLKRGWEPGVKLEDGSSRDFIGDVVLSHAPNLNVMAERLELLRDHGWFERNKAALQSLDISGFISANYRSLTGLTRIFEILLSVGCDVHKSVANCYVGGAAKDKLIECLAKAEGKSFGGSAEFTSKRVQPRRL